MTASAGPALKRLYREFGDRVAFLTLYVREAHPGETYPQPKTMEEKLRHARAYRDRDQIPWTIAADDLDGTLHRALEPKPNAAYLMDKDGRIAQRVLWSNDERVLRRAIELVLAGAPASELEPILVPSLSGSGYVKPVLAAAGPAALADLRRAAPEVHLFSRFADLFRLVPRQNRGYVAAGTLAAALAMVAGLGTWAARRRPGVQR